MPLTGNSRSSVHRDHALITPESHVPLLLPAWPGTETVALITAELGAGFAQYLVTCTAGAQLQALASGREYFILVMAGELTFEGITLASPAAGEYIYLPPESGWQANASAETELLIFEKQYEPAGDLSPPVACHRALHDVPAEPFLGDEGALLQTLLPADIAFDWGINLFEFAPGGTLPQVETHFMQHGLYLLQGEGVYRLGDHWYTVQAGDAIWMAPYLLQWFAATGKHNARYIYYKEMNRAPAV